MDCRLLRGVCFLFSVVVGIYADFDIVILHTNDVHARVGETNTFSSLCDPEDIAEDLCYAGVARRLTKVEEIRNTNDNVLLLDGGDQYQGTIWFTYYQGWEASHFMNRLGYDAMVTPFYFIIINY